MNYNFKKLTALNNKTFISKVNDIISKFQGTPISEDEVESKNTVLSNHVFEKGMDALKNSIPSGGGGDSGIVIAEFTLDPEKDPTEEGAITCDKTVEDLITAINQGKTVIGRIFESGEESRYCVYLYVKTYEEYYENDGTSRINFSSYPDIDNDIIYNTISFTLLAPNTVNNVELDSEIETPESIEYEVRESNDAFSLYTYDSQSKEYTYCTSSMIQASGSRIVSILRAVDAGFFYVIRSYSNIQELLESKYCFSAVIVENNKTYLEQFIYTPGLSEGTPNLTRELIEIGGSSESTSVVFDVEEGENSYYVPVDATMADIFEAINDGKMVYLRLTTEGGEEMFHYAEKVNGDSDEFGYKFVSVRDTRDFEDMHADLDPDAIFYRTLYTYNDRGFKSKNKQLFPAAGGKEVKIVKLKQATEGEPNEYKFADPNMSYETIMSWIEDGYYVAVDLPSGLPVGRSIMPLTNYYDSTSSGIELQFSIIYASGNTGESLKMAVLYGANTFSTNFHLIRK